MVHLAQATQCALCGMAKSLPGGIGLPQRTHVPKSGSSILDCMYCKRSSFCSACLRAASVTLLLLMASIRDTLPMLFSGAMGCERSLYSFTRALVRAISLFSSSAIFSLSDMVCCLLVMWELRTTAMGSLLPTNIRIIRQMAICLVADQNLCIFNATTNDWVCLLIKNQRQ